MSTAKAEVTAKLKEGVELRPYGASSLVNAENLTDEMAVLFLGNGSATEDQFHTLPKGYKADQGGIKEPNKNTSKRKAAPKAAPKKEDVPVNSAELAAVKESAKEIEKTETNQ